MNTEKYLQEVDEFCRKHKVRFTAIRRQILTLIIKNAAPIKAYDLLDLYREEVKTAEPPTVYRALNFLMDNGIIHKIESSNSYAICSNPELKASCHLIICDGCNKVVEVFDDSISDQLSN